MAILTNSAQETDKINQLLERKIPSHRQAYSDRTAWLMACLSELAYLRFNPFFSDGQKEHFIANIEKLMDAKRVAKLTALVGVVGYDHEEERKSLEAELGHVRLKLTETFDRKGTQAILVKSDKFVALAFRGTEATSLQDIKADCSATFVPCESGGRVHVGFNDAYEQVAADIQTKLESEEYAGLPLFITGHSLGGALATIAAKRIQHHAGIAACYTFGSPRVGDEDWSEGMRTIVYRIVNAADCVTMLPPGDMIVTALGWLAGFLSDRVKTWILKFGGYCHVGDMRYLTNCSQGKYEDVRLLHAVSFFRRLKGLLARGMPWKKFLADHSVRIYRKKLMVVACKRNPKI